MRTGLEALLPRVEVQRRELAEVGVAHVHIERLALVDVGAAVRRHVNQHALLDLPNSLVQLLQVLRDVQVLYSNLKFEFECYLKRALLKARWLQRGRQAQLGGSSTAEGRQWQCV